ncbi:MAG: CGNR zinc finger domain-containing protein [Acidimicrobiales bacterium]
MDFESYADFAVDLVSSEPDELDGADPLTSLEGLRVFLATWPWMSGRAHAKDLTPLVRLRRELRAVFDAAADARSADMVERLNRLLERHRPQPSISGHDDCDWHLHIADDQGPVATEFATGAVMGLAMAFLDLGANRFGSCADPRCSGVFLDTSRNRSRRYCSDRCASRANVAAHRERQRSGPS